MNEKDIKLAVARDIMTKAIEEAENAPYYVNKQTFSKDDAIVITHTIRTQLKDLLYTSILQTVELPNKEVEKFNKRINTLEYDMLQGIHENW